MRPVVFLAACVTGFSAAHAPAHAQGTEADKAAVSNLAKKYEAVFAKGDAKGVAALYATDGVLTDAFGVVNVGRTEIQKTTAANFAGPFKGATLIITQGPTAFVKPDVAVGRGTYEIRAGTNSMAKGMYLVVSVKGADGWHIAAQQNMAPAPPPPSGKAY